MHRFLLAIAGAVLLAAAPALSETNVVTVGHNSLNPATLTVPAGTTVTFRNKDQMPGGHTVLAEDGSFESPGLAKGEEWSHTFEKPGSYAYHIKEHPAAKGTIIVE